MLNNLTRYLRRRHYRQLEAAQRRIDAAVAYRERRELHANMIAAAKARAPQVTK